MEAIVVALITGGLSLLGVVITTASGNRIFAYLRYSNGSHSVTIFDYEEGLIKWKHEFILN